MAAAEEPGDDAGAAGFLQSNAFFCAVLAVLLFIYFASERSVLHFSRTLRRIYFLALVTLVSYWLLMAVRQASSSRIELAMVFVIVFASVVEDKMERSFYLTPFASAALEAVTGTPEAVGKAELLGEIVRGMTSWQGFSIGLAKQLAWLDGSLHKRQAAVHQVFEGADAGELNYMLAHTNCPFLLEVAADKSVELLSSPAGRLGDLTVLSRAILLDGFQKLGLRHRPSRQAAAACILLHTRGQALSALKSHLDDAPDHHTAFKLLYSDLQGARQQEVLEHVGKQGRRALQQFLKTRPHAPAMTLKVVSDIDDTLICSGGKFPAGSDLRFPRNSVYPGVLAFYRGLDAAFAAANQTDGAGGECCTEARQDCPSPESSAAATQPDSPAGSSPRSSCSGAQRPPLSPGSRPTPQQRGEGRPVVSRLTTQLRSQRGEAGGGARAPPPEPEPRAQGGASAAGAAIEAVLPSAGSLQNMVGLTLLGSSPEGSGLRSLRAQISGGRSRTTDSLAAAAGGAEPRCQQASGHLVFLSARPESYKGLTEVLSFKRIFRPLVCSGELQGYPVLLLGSMRVGPTALYAYAADRRGRLGPASLQFYGALCAKKLARFKQFAAVYPECCWAFVGDNGQGDVLLAEHLTELLGDRLVACFLHQVVPLEETVTALRGGRARVGSREAAAWPARWRRQRIHLAADYVSLAALAHEHGLLDDTGLHLTAAEACRDFRRLGARCAHAAFDRAAATAQLNAGLAAANAALPPHLQVEPLACAEP